MIKNSRVRNSRTFPGEGEGENPLQLPILPWGRGIVELELGWEQTQNNILGLIRQIFIEDGDLIEKVITKNRCCIVVQGMPILRFFELQSKLAKKFSQKLKFSNWFSNLPQDHNFLYRNGAHSPSLNSMSQNTLTVWASFTSGLCARSYG